MESTFGSCARSRAKEERLCGAAWLPPLVNAEGNDHSPPTRQPAGGPLVTFADSSRACYLARCRADQGLKQVAYLTLLRQGVGQPQLGPHLVVIPSALPLAQDVPLVDQLGQDSVGGAFGDPDGGGDVAQADAGVASHANQDVSVVGQEVPAGGGPLRALLHHTGKVFHELVILCLYGRGAHTDSSSITDSNRFTDPGRFTDPIPANRARGVHTTGGKMTTPIVNEPVAGYDRLKAKDVVASLSTRSRRELAAIASYERAHRNRKAVFNKLRRLRHDEPLRGPEALSTEQVVAALRRLQADRLPLVSRDAKRQLGLSPRG
jgi:hypothetical protein